MGLLGFDLELCEWILFELLLLVHVLLVGIEVGILAVGLSQAQVVAQAFQVWRAIHQ